MNSVLQQAGFHDFFYWRIVLDILLLTLAVYGLYRTLISTGAWKIVLGLFVALSGFGLANLLQLRGIEWIFSNLSQITLIGIIILFQPEIRRILERTTHLRRRRIQPGEETLPALLDDVLSYLAERRRGALIVIPGKDPVDHWVAGGLVLDASISFPILASIFDPNSPGHDGAIIIDNNRITRFGGRLPLSRNDDLSMDLGTRHHAGMGLSEETDALVLLVSEETGAIRAFHDGRMENLPQKGKVSSRIARHMKENASYIKPLSSERNRWRIGFELAACLFMALFFWSTVIQSKTEIREMAFTVPIEYGSSPQNLILSPDRPTEVKVFLEGPIDILQTVDLTYLRVQVDLSNMVAGKKTIALTNKNIRVARNLRVVDIKPVMLEIELMAVQEREMLIKPQFVGVLPNGFQIGSVSIEPRIARVLLPKGEQEKILPYLLTTPIYLSGIQESTSVFCKIMAPVDVQPLERRWPDVEVRITLVSK